MVMAPPPQPPENITIDDGGRVYTLRGKTTNNIHDYYKTMPKSTLTTQGAAYLKNRSDSKYKTIMGILRFFIVTGVTLFLILVCYFYFFAGNELYKSGKNSIDKHNNKIHNEMIEAEKPL